MTAAVGAAAPRMIRFARRGELRVLNYHRIEHCPPDFPLDPDVISASPALFERQVAFCRRHFDVLSFADLQAIVSGARRMPARPLIITFDDGYEDNYRHAYPILRHQGLSAIFFLAAEYIGTERLFWWDAVALALGVHEAKDFDLHVSGASHRLDVSTPAARRESTRRVLRIAKGVPDAERRRMVAELSDRASASRYHVPRQIMTWDEAREMADHGMEIGSHTMSHPVLARVADDAALEHEVAGSKRVLEERTGCPVNVLSYPVGGPAAFDDRVKSVVRRAGYDFAVTYINGTNCIDDRTDFYALNRLHLDGLTESEFRTRLVVPRL